MAKPQINIGFDAELLKQLDSLIDKVKFRSRAHVAEYLIRKGLEAEKIIFETEPSEPQK